MPNRGKDKKMFGKALPLTLILLAMLASVAVADTYSGSLSTPDGTTGTLRGDGDWWPVSLAWDVYQNGGLWHYRYELTVARKNISHFIIGASENFTEADNIFNNTWPEDKTVVQLNTAANGNPTIPGDLYGIRFNSIVGGTHWIIDFDSNRMPVWQDVYFRCGASDGILNSVWNEGFLRANPTDPAADGALDNHILAPDSVIPEPGTVGLLGLGLAGLFAKRKRR
jgi:hypothetical protein